MMATASATRNSEAQVILCTLVQHTDDTTGFFFTGCIQLQRRAELKKKLEALAKYETVQRIKVHTAAILRKPYMRDMWLKAVLYV